MVMMHMHDDAYAYSSVVTGFVDDNFQHGFVQNQRFRSTLRLQTETNILIFEVAGKY